MISPAPRRSRSWTASVLIALACLVPLASAQVAPASSHDADAGTIRVYANLLQIPVLVLDRFQRPVPPIDPAKFTIQFDDGAPMRPKMVRQEGEDPITLAVLLDASHGNHLLPQLADALGTLTPGQLGPRDRIVIYKTDGCHLRRYGQLLPAQRGLVVANTHFAVDDKPSTETCAQTMGLWRSMAVVVSLLHGEPGRRILLAVTNGADNSHDFDSEKTHQVAVDSGVAIFSVGERGKIAPGSVTTQSISIPKPIRGGGTTAVPIFMYGLPELAVISELSGGLLLQTDPDGLDATLSRFVSLVRNRYIVEFTRPSGLSGGRHIMTIACGQPRYFIRAAGTSMPSADPTQPASGVQHGPSSPNPPDPDPITLEEKSQLAPDRGASTEPAAPARP